MDIQEAGRLYESLRRSGKHRKVAKQVVYEKYPLLYGDVAVGDSNISEWGNVVQQVERRLRQEQAADADTLVLTSPPQVYETASGVTRRLFKNFVERQRPEVGDTYTFSPNQIADLYQMWTGKKVKSNSFVNEFLQSQKYSTLQKEGWRFEVVSNDYESYTVRIQEMPRPTEPEPLYTQEQVQRMVAEAAEAAVRQLMESLVTARPTTQPRVTNGTQMLPL